MPDATSDQPPAEPVDVYAIIMLWLDQMASIAWQKMGLQPDMATGQIAKDLKQAKTAIDVAAGLAAFLEPELDQSDKRRIHNLVTDLRMNYVQQSDSGGDDA